MRLQPAQQACLGAFFSGLAKAGARSMPKIMDQSHFYFTLLLHQLCNFDVLKDLESEKIYLEKKNNLIFLQNLDIN